MVIMITVLVTITKHMVDLCPLLTSLKEIQCLWLNQPLPSSLWMSLPLCCEQRVMASPLQPNKSSPGNTQGERWHTVLHDKKRLNSHCMNNIFPILQSLQCLSKLCSCSLLCLDCYRSPTSTSPTVACDTDIASTTISHFYHFPSIFPPCSSTHSR